MFLSPGSPAKSSKSAFHGQADLICPCPVAECPNNVKPISWVHSDCGGKTRLRFSDVYIKCSRCQKEEAIFNWKFKCENHDYKPASLQGCMHALAIMGQMQGNQQQIRKATELLLVRWPK